MRILPFLLLFFSINAFGANHFACFNDLVQLDIEVTEKDEQKNVSWELRLVADQSTLHAGSGVWQKETESIDAFSSFDESTAISYKNQRAVLVLPDDQAIYFPACHSI